MWCASLGIRPHTTQDWVVRYRQCSLSRSRIVFAATRRRRRPAGSCGRERGRRRSIHCLQESLPARKHDAIILCRINLSFGNCWVCFKRQDPFAETGLHAVRVGGRQGVLDRKILVNPVRRLVRRLKLGQVPDQPVALRRGFLDAQRGTREANSRPISSLPSLR